MVKSFNDNAIEERFLTLEGLINALNKWEFIRR